MSDEALEVDREIRAGIGLALRLKRPKCPHCGEPYTFDGRSWWPTCWAYPDSCSGSPL